MSRSKLLLAVAVLAVLVGASLFGSGQSAQGSAGPVNLTFWNGFTAADGDALRGIVKNWNQQNPDTNIEMTIIGWATFYDKLATSIAAGRGPDFVAFHYDRIAEYASRGQLVPLDDYMDTLALNPSDFVEVPWNGGIYEGKRYSVPLDWMPLIGLYYNKDHYIDVGLDPNKPPTDLQSFVSYNQKLKSADRWGYMVSRATPLARLYLSMVYQFEGSLLTDDYSKSAVNTEAGLAAAQVMYDFIYKYKIAPKDTAPNEEATAFKAGTLTHVLHHLAMSNDFKAQTGLNMGYAAIPVFGRKQAVYTNTHQLAIPMPSKIDQNRIAGTLRFIRWLLNDQGMQWAAAGQLPVKKSILQSAAFKQQFDLHQGQVAMAPYVFFPDKVVKWSEVYSRIDPNLQALVLDEMSPKETVVKMAREMDDILKN